ncbi:PH domain-containing protein [Aureibaculum luteum]|uniref:PH domain-containing protein n=1 Tax=Aureibaculum luteum TaxID=1548456 RepID=UPI000E4D4841|nr:PH domain-containing protein [Aureibaculum luteum]
MKIDLLVKVSVINEIDEKDKLIGVSNLLVDDELVELAFKHTRDKVWFTDKRLIAMDVQGFTGSKKEFRSFPYSKISSFSVETAGTFDGDSDFKIWISGIGVFEIKFHRRLDIKKIGKYLSNKIL